MVTMFPFGLVKPDSVKTEVNIFDINDGNKTRKENIAWI